MSTRFLARLIICVGVGLYAGVGICLIYYSSLDGFLAARPDSPKDPSKRTVSLRGVIREVDLGKQKILMDIHNPYSPGHSEQAFVFLDKNTVFLKNPLLSATPEDMVYSSNPEAGMVSSLVPGSIASARVSPGENGVLHVVRIFYP